MWSYCWTLKTRCGGFKRYISGGLNCSIVEPRSVFRSAIVAGNIASILIGHNHPSGDCTPSNEDIAVTRKLVEGGKILGIDVLDHVIVGEDGAYVSFREKGLI